MKKFIVMLVAVVVVAGCGGGGGGGSDTPAAATPVAITEENNKAAYDAAVAPLNNAYSLYKDARAIALVTPRISLATPISNLQTIKRDADALVVPKCLETAKSFLSGGMLNVNAAFIDFMAQGSSVTFLMDIGDTSFKAYEEELLRQKLCDFTIM